MYVGRHYVTRTERRWKPYSVVRSEIGPPRAVSGRRTMVSIRYVTVSRHWTHESARKAAKALEREAGFAH